MSAIQDPLNNLGNSRLIHHPEQSKSLPLSMGAFVYPPSSMPAKAAAGYPARCSNCCTRVGWLAVIEARTIKVGDR